MLRHNLALAAAVALALTTTACKSNRVTNAVQSAGETVADGAQGVASTATSLVNVNLSNVLNDLSLDLDIDRANIPINAQIPITLAANVCGVSINILSVSTGGNATCTAQTSSPELAQVVQQQIAAGGSVGGGAQGGSTATTSTSTGTGTDATGGATSTTGTSTGTTTTTDTDNDPTTPQS